MTRRDFLKWAMATAVSLHLLSWFTDTVQASSTVIDNNYSQFPVSFPFSFYAPLPMRLTFIPMIKRGD